ncbi:MAG TPA: SRPBCC domain-containing protein [Thermoanaerobaculia bacterium]|nr:SRPBCC domain-containing protein [Thermoanaerobaculia bacterium]
METSTTAVTQTRTIKATAQEVFAAWTDPALIPLWLGAGPNVVTTAEVDARVGGHYRIETRVAEDVHVTTGEYRELEPGRRLVKTWIYRGPLAEFEHHETLVTVDFRETGPGVTELTLKHERLPSTKYADSVRQGWAACFDNLETLASEGRLAPARSGA